MKYSYEEYIKLSKEEKAQSEKIDFDTAMFYIKEQEIIEDNLITDADGTFKHDVIRLAFNIFEYLLRK